MSTVSATDLSRHRHDSDTPADFPSRPDDIYIVTYPRSGTTWVQMMLYQLTTSGEMSFLHISQVVPFLERAIRMGLDLAALKSPRVFKTHMPFRFLSAKPGKFIYVARDGKDVLVSYFHFYRTYLDFTGTFAEFFDRFMTGQVQYGSWFRHVAEWKAHAGDPNVLFLNYEDLCASFDESLRRIIAFCGLDIPPDRYGEIRTRCSFEFMKRHERQFDHNTEIAWELLELGSQSTFLRRGQVGSWKEQLTASQDAAFDQAARSWRRAEVAS
jgi:hypothetical protein